MAITEDDALWNQRAGQVSVPTLVLFSEGTSAYLGDSARRAANSIPNARSRTLPGQFHDVDAETLAAELTTFLGKQQRTSAPPTSTSEMEAKMTDESPYDIELTRVFDAPADRVYRVFTVPDEFAQWYGPVGFPARRDSVQLDPRVGGLQQFTMVSEDDPSMRTAFDGRFTQVVDNQLLESSGSWDGIPGQEDPWESHLRVEFYAEDGKTRVVLREGPHPAGTADLGRQAWEMMFAKLDTLLANQP